MHLENLANILPFLSARLNTPIEELAAQPVNEVLRTFGEHTVLFLQEIVDQPARANALTIAEQKAWPAIKEAAALAGIGNPHSALTVH